MYVRYTHTDLLATIVVRIELDLGPEDRGYPLGFVFELPEIPGWDLVPRDGDSKYFARVERDGNPYRLPWVGVVQGLTFEAVLASRVGWREAQPTPVVKAVARLVAALNRAGANLVE